MIDSNKILEAIERLKLGEIVVLPTETVYGLAVDAFNEDAIKKVYQLKGRPILHPLIVHISPIKKEIKNTYQEWRIVLEKWTSNIPTEALKLAVKFWPGPLTMVLNKSKKLSYLVTGEQETVAIRCPNHPIAIRILENFANGLVVPSANYFGKTSPTCVQDVLNEFQNKDLFFLDGGRCSVGIESTIVDLSYTKQSKVKILRPGIITRSEILECLEYKEDLTEDRKHSTENHFPRVPGSLPSHYTPKTPLILLSNCGVLLPNFSNKRVVYIRLDGDITLFKTAYELKIIDWGLDVQKYAYNLYKCFHDCDKKEYDFIVFDPLPNEEKWACIKDRLIRASNYFLNIPK